MLSYYDPRQRTHAPLQELQDGAFVAYAEAPERLDSILAALGETRAPRDYGLEPIRRVHDADYVRFLQTVHQRWAAEGRAGDAIPYAFPVRGRRPLEFERVDATLGRFAFDAGTPITADTWDAAYWAAQTALSGLSALSATPDMPVFALCRPPGHHAGADYCGGYCYLNNSAIAAEAALADGAERVAILDVDYHHGNGTQDLFYDRRDVFFASIHADPKIDFPFYWGHADERGTGAGEGATLNLPLPRRARIDAFLDALEQACVAVDRHGVDLLIVSFGADTYAYDPISELKLEMEDYPRLSQRIARLGRPTLVVMEGGYAIPALGRITKGFLSGFAT